MRRVAHISDLHFGRADENLIEPLCAELHALKPDLVVVSGDLTQRAKRRQFKQAREFLDQLPRPQIVVPGNHDVPLRNLWDRFFNPYAKYRKFISGELNPNYLDDEVAVFAVNTARFLTTERGSISEKQIENARRFFSEVDRRCIRIVVTHHPFDIPEALPDKYLLRRAHQAMAAFALLDADLFLAGHAHVGFHGVSARRYRIEGHSALIIQAGTSISTRRRGEPNSFNVITIQRPHIAVRRYDWGGQQFTPGSEACFRHSEAGWQPEKKTA